MENLKLLGIKFKWKLGVIMAAHAKFYQILKLPSL
jgi:hypothetical protein